MRQIRKTVFFLLLCAALALPAAASVLEPVENAWKFLSPTGLLLEEDGSLLVADSGLNNVVSLTGETGTLVAGYTLPFNAAGRPVGGHLDVSAGQSLFRSPFALAKWGGGLVVSDRDNHCLRLIADGKVRTLAGDGQEGFINGAAASARFSMPLGLAVGEDGLLYIADSGNGCIRALSPEGTVSTYVTGLHEPAGLCWSGGILYVTDVGSHQIFQVKDGVLTLLAGRSTPDDEAFIGGFADGDALSAEFSTPFGILAQGDTLYISDTGNSAIRQLRDGWVSTLACYGGSSDSLWPASPIGLALDGQTLYAADAFAGRLLRLDLTRQLFDDVPAGSWYADGASYAYTAGIMRGTSQTTFAPDAEMSRGQLVTILHRLEGQPTAQPSAFPDVAEGAYYTKAVAWAAQTGLVQGGDDGAFHPDDVLTREQLAALLYRYTGANGDKIPVDLSAYPDGDQVSPFAAQATAWACGQGLLQGNDSGLLLPQGAVTRGQAAVLLSRFLTAPGR